MHVVHVHPATVADGNLTPGGSPGCSWLRRRLRREPGSGGRRGGYGSALLRVPRQKGRTPRAGPSGEADVTGAPVDEGSGAGVCGATVASRDGTTARTGSSSSATVVVCSGSTGRNSVRSSCRTSGAGSTTRTSARPAIRSSTAGSGPHHGGEDTGTMRAVSGGLGGGGLRGVVVRPPQPDLVDAVARQLVTELAVVGLLLVTGQGGVEHPGDHVLRHPVDRDLARPGCGPPAAAPGRTPGPPPRRPAPPAACPGA